MFTLLSRNEFRAKVFVRDNHQCVICGKSDVLDAHHIIERRLWDDEGYYLENGATLCSQHHILAEQTVLSCDEIRDAAGITDIILPSHLYKDEKYDKWGNIILGNGQRIIGELFFDESVQKILKSGGVLELFGKYIKYPRTYHLPWSNATKDDRILSDTKHFEGEKVVVSVKMDGECSNFYRDHFHARSIDSDSHPSQSWIRKFHSDISYEIPEGWRICGENLYAKHTIHYKHLRNYFLVFSVWNERNECLSWSETKEWCELLGLETVPVIYEGIWDKGLIKGLYQDTIGGDDMEGYVVRLEKSFRYEDFRKSVAKYVSPHFLSSLKGSFNWRYRSFSVNKKLVSGEKI